MSIVALNEEVLGFFNNLLHDLYFDVPEEGFELEDGTLCINLFDKEHCIHRDFVARYRLCIHEVVRVETLGDVHELPGDETQLNEMHFNANQRLLSIDCVYPLKINCYIRELRATLDQLV